MSEGGERRTSGRVKFIFVQLSISELQRKKSEPKKNDFELSYVLCISQIQFWYYEIQIQTYNMYLHHQLLPTTRRLVISDKIVHTQSKKNLMRGEIIGMRELSIIERLILRWPI